MGALKMVRSGTPTRGILRLKRNWSRIIVTTNYSINRKTILLLFLFDRPFTLYYLFRLGIALRTPPPVQSKKNS